MAGSVPKPTVKSYPAGRSRQQTLALPRWASIRWLPPTLLALATILALIAAYSSRPAVTIDLGDYYDSAFLPNLGVRDSKVTDFHAREVGTTGVEPIAFDWPAAQATLDVPGGHAGILQATVEAAAGLPDDALDAVALTVNDVRVSIVRRAPRQMIALIPAEVAAAERLTFQIAPPSNGDPAPPPGLAGRVLLTPAVTYRWSSERSTISLPALGRGDWTITLNASLRHPDDTPLNATVYANGTPIGQLPDGGPRRLSLFVPAALVPDGDLDLTITADPYRDPRPLGVLIYDLRVTPAGARFWLPPLDSLLYALLIALGLYICLLRMSRRATAVCGAGAWRRAARRVGAGGGALPNRADAAAPGRAGDLERAAAAGAGAAADVGLWQSRCPLEQLGAARAAADVLCGLLA